MAVHVDRQRIAGWVSEWRTALFVSGAIPGQSLGGVANVAASQHIKTNAADLDTVDSWRRAADKQASSKRLE